MLCLPCFPEVALSDPWPLIWRWREWGSPGSLWHQALDLGLGPTPEGSGLGLSWPSVPLRDAEGRRHALQRPLHRALCHSGLAGSLQGPGTQL